MDRENSYRARRARRSVNDLLREFYLHWLRHFEHDSERFFERTLRLTNSVQSSGMSE
jgi:hypothetical protein